MGEGAATELILKSWALVRHFWCRTTEHTIYMIWALRKDGGRKGLKTLNSSRWCDGSTWSNLISIGLILRELLKPAIASGQKGLKVQLFEKQHQPTQTSKTCLTKLIMEAKTKRMDYHYITQTISDLLCFCKVGRVRFVPYLDKRPPKNSMDLPTTAWKMILPEFLESH